jgi:hypothetical protein
MNLLPHLIPWYKPEAVKERRDRTEAILLRAQASLKRVSEAQNRTDCMIQSYKRAGGKL